MRYIRWIVSGAIAFFMVWWLPELALGIMLVPFAGMTPDPYMNVMMMFAVSFAAAFVLMNMAEIGVILCALAVNSVIVHWSRHIELRKAVAELA